MVTTQIKKIIVAQYKEKFYNVDDHTRVRKV